MSNDNFQVNKQFANFKGKNVLGKIIAIDNFLNVVLDDGNGLKVIKGGKIAFISIKEDE